MTSWALNSRVVHISANILRGKIFQPSNVFVSKIALKNVNVIMGASVPHPGGLVKKTINFFNILCKVSCKECF